MHVTCSTFPSSSTFSLAPILLTMQYDQSKRTLGYILITTDLEKVEVVCTLLQLSAGYLDILFC